MKLTIEKQKEIIKDRLGIESNNNSTATLWKNRISIFGDRLIATKTNDLYVILPKSAKKTEEGSYDYDMSEHDIYKITNKDVDALDEFIESNERYSFDIDSLQKVFTTKSQSIVKSEKYTKNFTDYEKSCVYLQVPMSGNDIVDDLIKKSLNSKNNTRKYPEPF